MAGTMLAWSVFAIGMIAPLTPSEGPPPLGAVATFLGVPVLTFLGLARIARTKAARLTQLAQAALMAAPVVAIALSG